MLQASRSMELPVSSYHAKWLVDGRTVLVNRGWIQLRRNGPVDTTPMHIEGVQTVDGLIRQDRLKGYFVPITSRKMRFGFMSTRRKWRPESGAGTTLLCGPVTCGPLVMPIGAEGEIHVRRTSDPVRPGPLALTLIVIYVIYHLKPEDEAERTVTGSAYAALRNVSDDIPLFGQAVFSAGIRKP